VTFDPFDIAVVPFPFTDMPVTKRRPALVLSTRLFMEDHQQAVLAMITAAGRSDWPSDVILQGWRQAGLSIPCRVRFKLFTLGLDMIERRIGGLDEGDRRAVQASLAKNLALS
jgi:mRNA interferase MazF